MSSLPCALLIASLLGAGITRIDAQGQVRTSTGLYQSATAGDDYRTNFTIGPGVVLNHTGSGNRLQLSYNANINTSSENFSDVLATHRLRLSSNHAINERTGASAYLTATIGRTNFEQITQGAVGDVLEEDLPLDNTVPQTGVIRFGRMGVGASVGYRLRPRIRWSQTVSGRFFIVPDLDPGVQLVSLRRQRAVNLVEQLTYTVDRRLSLNGNVGAGLVDFDDGFRFYNIRANVGTTWGRARFTVQGQMGGRILVETEQTDQVRIGPETSAGFRYRLALASQKRAALSMNAGLRPYFDPFTGSLDTRARLQTAFVMSVWRNLSFRVSNSWTFLTGIARLGPRRNADRLVGSIVASVSQRLSENLRLRMAVRATGRWRDFDRLATPDDPDRLDVTIFDGVGDAVRFDATFLTTLVAGLGLLN